MSQLAWGHQGWLSEGRGRRAEWKLDKQTRRSVDGEGRTFGPEKTEHVKAQDRVPYGQTSVFFLGPAGKRMVGERIQLKRCEEFILHCEGTSGSKSLAINYRTSFQQCAEDELEGNKTEDRAT